MHPEQRKGKFLMSATAMNHRDGKWGTCAHKVGVNDEQTEMQSGCHWSSTRECFKARCMNANRKPFLFKETAELVRRAEPDPVSPVTLSNLPLPRREIFQVIIKSQLLFFPFFF